MTKTDKFLATVPFSGFYESIHSDEVDRALENILTDRETGAVPAPDFIQEAAWMGIDYPSIYEKYAECYAESLLQWLGLYGEFESMSSPREYNFGTDRMFVHLTRADVVRIWKNTPRDIFEESCKERFTSYDGFRSFYSPDWRTWGKLTEWDHNQLGTLLGAFAFAQYREETASKSWDIWAEHALVEDLACNGNIEDWIFEFSESRFTRAVNAWDYLQERAKRAIKTLDQWHAARRAENRPFTDTPLGRAIL